MRKTILAIGCALGLGLTATNANADAIPLDFGDSHYVGLFVPDHPADPNSELDFINYLKGLDPGVFDIVYGANTYNRIGSPNALSDLPTVTSVGFKVDGSDLQPGNINVVGYAYILGKYDGQNAGAYVWYVQGLETVSLPTTSVNPFPPPSGYGLSHYATFNAATVPDGGATLMLLGGALVGLGLLRRSFSA